MNIKESYQYQNHLSAMIHEVKGWLMYDRYLTKKSRQHKYNEANQEIENSITDESSERPFAPFTPDTLIEFLIALLEERELLSEAIGSAKYALKAHWNDPMDIDAALSSNKTRNEMIETLKRLTRIKPETVVKTYGEAFKFNEEGNQITYRYPIEDTTKIDFARPQLLRTIKALQSKANDTSMKAERLMINTEVKFKPMFDMSDDTLDAIAAWLEVPDCKADTQEYSD